MQYSSVTAKPTDPPDEFDLIDDRRPRGEGFVSIGAVARPMVTRLRAHLIDKGVIAQVDARESDPW